MLEWSVVVDDGPQGEGLSVLLFMASDGLQLAMCAAVCRACHLPGMAGCLYLDKIIFHDIHDSRETSVFPPSGRPAKLYHA